MTSDDTDDETAASTDETTAASADDEMAASTDALTDPAPTTGDHPGGPRRETAPFPAVADGVREVLGGDATGHDMTHVWRVFRLGTDFAADLGADVEVVGAAALVHDLHRVVDGGVDPVETLPRIRSLLAATPFPDEKVGAVEHAVAVHDNYRYRGDDDLPETLEAEILRDADNLDAMGAVGVGRTFAYGGANGSPMWDPDGEAYSQLYHFEDKLLRLREEMHTDPARELAERRHEFLEQFRERFQREWHGET